MRYLQIEERLADGYICPWRNSECLGALCMAWTPDDDLEVSEDAGLCPARRIDVVGGAPIPGGAVRRPRGGSRRGIF